DDGASRGVVVVCHGSGRLGVADRRLLRGVATVNSSGSPGGTVSTDPRPDEAGDRPDDAAPPAQDDTTAGTAEQDAAVAPGEPGEPPTPESHGPETPGPETPGSEAHAAGPLPDPPSDVPHDAGSP